MAVGHKKRGMGSRGPYVKKKTTYIELIIKELEEMIKDYGEAPHRSYAIKIMREYEKELERSRSYHRRLQALSYKQQKGL